jgi:tRNA threonylcarbamoyl adenosine modification protein (Sua5/YciO/YrdC/YwlC family)
MPTPILEIDPERPNPRILDKAVIALQGGGLIAYPTDSYYGLGCDLFNKRALEKLYQLKRRDPRKPVSFVCHDLATVSQYAQISDQAFRALRRLTPGPYTFILPATNLVPHLVTTRQKTVGARIPNNRVALGLAERLGRPIATTSAATPEGEPLVDPKDIRDIIGHALELVLGGGYQLREPSTVLSFATDEPRILRSGKGHAEAEALFQFA